MGDHGGPSRGLPTPRSQTDGRKPIPHVITAAVSIVLSLVVAHVAGLAGKTGPAGPAGKSAHAAGICAYFGPTSSGHTRFQVSTPAADGSCSKGVFVSVTPGQ